MSKDKSAKIPTPQAVRGTQDMLGDDADRFAHVVDTFERVRRLYGFKRVEVPVFEPTAVFARSIGETTDVVSKEMYSFEDRGGEFDHAAARIHRRHLRAPISPKAGSNIAPLKVATHGPLFRYERPQKGRYRQFHQLDAEIIGAAEPHADVELLVLADQLLNELGIGEGVTLTAQHAGRCRQPRCVARGAGRAFRGASRRSVRGQPRAARQESAAHPRQQGPARPADRRQRAAISTPI